MIKYSKHNNNKTNYRWARAENPVQNNEEIEKEKEREGKKEGKIRKKKRGSDLRKKKVRLQDKGNMRVLWCESKINKQKSKSLSERRRGEKEREKERGERERKAKRM